MTDGWIYNGWQMDRWMHGWQMMAIKDQYQLQEEKLPFFDFSSLKSRTFQIILASTFVSSFGNLKNIERLNLISQPGMFTPIILLFQQSELERISLGGATTIQVAYIINLIWAGQKWTFLLEENWNHFHTRPTLALPGSVGLSLLEWWDWQSCCNYNYSYNHFDALGDALEC